ncbi:MAG: DUF2442 domain-containing protein [Gemmatimonadota bacterium]
MERSWKPITSEEFDRQYADAVERGRTADEAGPCAREAWYDAESGRIMIELKDGCVFGFPPEIAQGLRDADPERLAAVEIEGDGYALRWDELDVDFTVPGLLAGRFGSKRWMSELGRAGGSVTSEAKARAARQNGKKGGRPRKAG